MDRGSYFKGGMLKRLSQRAAAVDGEWWKTEMSLARKVQKPRRGYNQVLTLLRPPFDFRDIALHLISSHRSNISSGTDCGWRPLQIIANAECDKRLAFPLRTLSMARTLPATAAAIHSCAELFMPLVLPHSGGSLMFFRTCALEKVRYKKFASRGCSSGSLCSCTKWRCQRFLMRHNVLQNNTSF